MHNMNSVKISDLLREIADFLDEQEKNPVALEGKHRMIVSLSDRQADYSDLAKMFQDGVLLLRASIKPYGFAG